MLTGRGQQHSFSNHERMFLWKCQRFDTENVWNREGLEPPTLGLTPNALTIWAIIIVRCVCWVILSITRMVLKIWVTVTEHWIRDKFVCAPRKWETTLQCEVVFHWLGTYTKISLLHNAMSKLLPASFVSRDPLTRECMVVAHSSYLGLTDEPGKLHAYRTSPREYPANTQRNKHVMITSKLRFDVIITCLLCFVLAW